MKAKIFTKLYKRFFNLLLAIGIRDENSNKIKKIIHKQFLENVGYEPNFENPKSYNEKIQWLKLYYHNPIINICADKYRVRDYIKQEVGDNI